MIPKTTIIDLISELEKEKETANRLKRFASDDFTKGCESEKVLVLSNVIERLKELIR